MKLKYDPKWNFQQFLHANYGNTPTEAEIEEAADNFVASEERHFSKVMDMHDMLDEMRGDFDDFNDDDICEF